jgi:Family of unknown function (DUF5990)
MFVEILGTNFPGRSCGCGPEGEVYENIHVGIGMQREPVELVPGDAPSARWRIEVRTRTSPGGHHPEPDMNYPRSAALCRCDASGGRRRNV